LVEHQLWELAVAGSNPVAPTILFSTSARCRNFSSLRKLQQAFLLRRFGRNSIFFNRIKPFYAFSHRKIPLGITIA
jgi:hypothetical protein